MSIYNTQFIPDMSNCCYNLRDLHANTALYHQEFHRCRISISWCFWSIRATWGIMIIVIRIPLFNLRPLINDVPTNMRMILYGTYHYNAFIPLINILSIKSSLAHLNAFVLTSVCEIQNSDLCKRSTVNVLSEHQCSSKISLLSSRHS